MGKDLKAAGIILMILGAALFIGCHTTTVKTITEEVPYSDEIPYQIEVAYVETEPYQEMVPYEVNVSFTKIEPVYEIHETYTNGSFTHEIYLGNGTIEIDWTSNKTLLLFGVMRKGTFDEIKADFELATGVTFWLFILMPVLLPLFVINYIPYLRNATAINASPDDYYKIDSKQGSSTKNVTEGLYEVIVFNSQQNNMVDASVSRLVEAVESKVTYRNETMYRNVTRTRNETRYRVEEGVRLEERTIKQPLLALPDIGILSWDFIAIAVFLTGLVLSRRTSTQ
jgi:hypothetical protein